MPDTRVVRGTADPYEAKLSLIPRDRWLCDSLKIPNNANRTSQPQMSTFWKQKEEEVRQDEVTQRYDAESTASCIPIISIRDSQAASDRALSEMYRRRITSAQSISCPPTGKDEGAAMICIDGSPIRRVTGLTAMVACETHHRGETGDIGVVFLDNKRCFSVFLVESVWFAATTLRWIDRKSERRPPARGQSGLSQPQYSVNFAGPNLQVAHNYLIKGSRCS